jgi:opacity protein-like surface antigen
MEGIFMAYLRNLAMAGAAALALAPALATAADMPMPPAPMPVVEEFGGWYLRGDIGISSQRVKRLESPAPGFDTAPVVTKGFDSAGIYDLGIGYKFNNWLRVDVTGEYRAAATFNATQTFTCAVGAGCPNGIGSDQYIGNKSEWLFLANAYLDLGTWNSITPFIGAGVGFDRLTIGNFTDFSVVNGALGVSGDSSKWNFAWALYAGLGYQITPNCTFELSYRYLNLGNGSTKDLVSAFDGSNSVVNPIQFKNVYSNDIRIGLRWMLADNFMPAQYSEPLIRKY